MTARVTKIYEPDADPDEKSIPRSKIRGSHPIRLFLAEELYQRLKYLSAHHPNRLSMTQLCHDALLARYRPKYAFANSSRYAYGRLLWEHLSEERRVVIVEKLGGSEDVARETYVRWARSNPVYSD